MMKSFLVRLGTEVRALGTGWRVLAIALGGYGLQMIIVRFLQFVRARRQLPAPAPAVQRNVISQPAPAPAVQRRTASTQTPVIKPEYLQGISLKITSPLPGSVEKFAWPLNARHRRPRTWNDQEWDDEGRPQEGADLPAQEWAGRCSVCKRPIALETSWGPEWKEGTRWKKNESEPQYAFVVALWGTSSDYVLGALVLGHSLVNTGTKNSLVLLRTSEVQTAHIKLLQRVGWDTRQVEKVEGVRRLYVSDPSSHIFRYVFTKLHVMGLVDFDKVVMLDIDMIVTQPIDDLFKLEPPAAMRRGMQATRKPYKHGGWINGNDFFTGRCVGKDADEKARMWCWGQGVGINAGCMVLRPDADELENMLSEVAEPNHPAHAAGAGPEQDYLSRYFSDGWTHLSVLYNWQTHQMWNAFEPTLARAAERTKILEHIRHMEEGEVEKIRIYHFSGMKPWKRLLDPDFGNLWPDRGCDDTWLEIYLEHTFSYMLWGKMDEATWAAFGGDDMIVGHHRLKDGRIEQWVDADEDEPGRWCPSVGPSEGLVEAGRSVTSQALNTWYDTFEDLSSALLRDENVDLLEALNLDYSDDDLDDENVDYYDDLDDEGRQ